MYKVVEIGAATNFLADQMLKTRAGENVLALMSATIPVMDEESNVSLLASLFETANASPENIPGTGQLQSIRNNLAPLARKTGFRERVLRHHHWLWQVLHGHSPPPNEDPYNAIPVATDIPKIIRLLHKISTAVDTYVLMYNGIRGAAWVITYACSVLGLNACALDKNGDPVPVAGKYEDAKVVINLASLENNCQLYLAGTTTEHLISLQEPEQFKRRGWSIDCSTVNFVDLQHPGLRNSESFSRLSHFVALETMNSVTAWAATFHQDSIILPQASSRINTGFRPYTMSVLLILQQRSLEILRMLGFRPSQLSDYNFVKADDCATHNPIGHKLDPAPRLRVENSGGVNMNSKHNYRAKFLSYSLEAQYVPYGGIQYKENELLERLRLYLSDPPQSLFTTPQIPKPVLPITGGDYAAPFLALHQSLQSGIGSTVSIAINFASKLSFSNWNTTFGVMSVRAMSPTKQSKRAEENTFEGPISEAIELCVDGVKMIDLETRLWSQDWIALDLDGVVVFRELSRRYSIHDLNGKYLSFSPGRLLYEGLPCTKIRTDRTGIRYRGYEVPANTTKHNPRAGERLLPPESRPRSHSAGSRNFEDICVWKPRELCSRLGDTIFVRLEVILFSNTYIVVDSSRPASILPQVLVTNECPHGFSKVGLYNGKLGSDIDLSRLGISHDVSEGITFGGTSLLPMVFYQHTENVPVGQWLACHWKSEGLKILQNGCCLKCLFRRLGDLRLDQSRYPYPICIISGGENRCSDLASRQRHRSRSPVAHTHSEVPLSGTSTFTPYTPPNIVNELDAFFEKKWVISLLAKTAFQMREPQRDSSTKDSHIRSERAYLWIQAAFVIEALGDGSIVFSEIRQDPRCNLLLESWYELRAWLIVQTPTLEMVNCIRSAMKAYEALNATIPPAEKRRHWAYLGKGGRPETPPNVQSSSQVPPETIWRIPVPIITPQFPTPGTFPKREGPADRRQSM
jgi:hypothetical protein